MSTSIISDSQACPATHSHRFSHIAQRFAAGHDPAFCGRASQLVALNPAGIPETLIQQFPWIVYRLEQRGNGRLNKVPISHATGCRANCHDQINQITFDQAVQLVRDGKADGVGFVPYETSRLAIVDFDGVRDPITGVIEAEFLELIAGADSCTEVSVSGTGCHVFCWGIPRRQGKLATRIELYTQRQFIAVTGQLVAGCPQAIAEGQAWLDALVQKYAVPEQCAHRSTERRAEGGRVRATCQLRVTRRSVPGLLPAVEDAADEEFVAQISRIDSKFQTLFNSSGEFGYKSPSEADLALIAKLWFWADGDTDRCDRLFRMSKRMRSKWDTCHGAGGRTYGQLTIDRVLGNPTRSSVSQMRRLPESQNREAGNSVACSGIARNDADLYSVADNGATDNSITNNEPSSPLFPCLYTGVQYPRFRGYRGVSNAIKSRTLSAPPADIKRTVFGLARTLKACPALADKPISSHKRLVRQWYAANETHLGQWPFGDVWPMYLRGYGSAKTVMGSGNLDEAFRDASNRPLPAQASRYDPSGKRGKVAGKLKAMQKLVRLCVVLAERAGDQPFFIDSHSASLPLGVHDATVRRHLAALVKDRVLERISRGRWQDGKASEYRLLKTQNS